ncbi:MAG: formylglycine-generating enzyme family protein, partial [Candidatus Rokubacteria bacterium]|nr:formylglycine-generating enzyme family protein [Candidatus Rokubacteria bacterium]
KARKAGYRDWERTVEVAPNQRAEIVVDLEALGPARTISGDDGAEMILIPAGAFWMGAEQSEIDSFLAGCKTYKDAAHQCDEWGRREMPRHRVVLDAYYIDKYEVTNGLFDRFVRATGHRTTAEREGDGWVYQKKDDKWQWLKLNNVTWRNPNGAGASPSNHAVVQMSWHDADAYCRWAGKRLPTEAEWEKAARGTDGRRYPWGPDWDGSKANGDMKVGTTSAVGSYPGGVSPYGVHDMAGNANEWTSDWFDATYYDRSPERNPQGPSSGTKRVLRGGSWIGSTTVLRTTTRNYDYALDVRGANFGFRCAKTP